MKLTFLTNTVRRFRLAASVASVALLSFSSSGGALAAAPDAHKQSWQPQLQQQQNNQVNQAQPQPNLKVQPQPKQQQLQKQKTQQNRPKQNQQQKQIQQNDQKIRTQQQQIQKNNQKLQTQQQKQIQNQTKLQAQQQKQFPRFDWNTYHPGKRPPQWQQYRANFNPAPYQWNRPAPRVYYVPVYQAPPGWQYRRWNYGQTYPRAYWQQPYWISNYYNYGLQPPPYGYVWVRNGPDAMSVDVVSGLILQVVYGLFNSSGGAGF